MTDKPTAADGTHASFMPDKPQRPNLISPEAVSASEGSNMGIPAGSIAVPEALPLTPFSKDLDRNSVAVWDWVVNLTPAAS